MTVLRSDSIPGSEVQLWFDTEPAEEQERQREGAEDGEGSRREGARGGGGEGEDEDEGGGGQKGGGIRVLHTSPGPFYPPVRYGYKGVLPVRYGYKGVLLVRYGSKGVLPVRYSSKGVLLWLIVI